MSAPSSGIGLRPIAIILLTVATAIIHFALAFDWLFYANGLGYLVLVTLLYAPVAALAPYRGAVRWLLIAYTAATVIAWALIGARGPLAYVDKAIEVALIGLLALEGPRAAKR
jgi:hypothetical protein